MNNPTLFPKTLLDVEVNSETVLDLYRNCGLPSPLLDKIFHGLTWQALSDLVELTKIGLAGAHEGKAKLSDLSAVLRYILLHLLVKCQK